MSEQQRTSDACSCRADLDEPNPMHTPTCALRGVPLRGGEYWCVACQDNGCSECDDGDDRNEDHMKAEIERTERAVSEGKVSETPIHCAECSGYNTRTYKRDGRSYVYCSSCNEESERLGVPPPEQRRPTATVGRDVYDDCAQDLQCILTDVDNIGRLLGSNPVRNNVRDCQARIDRAVTRLSAKLRSHVEGAGRERATADELAPLAARIAKGRKKYANGCTVLSLIDEAGEVAHAVNKYEPEDRIRDELLDVAAVAMRLYFGEIDRGLEMDGLVQRRRESGPGATTADCAPVAEVVDGECMQDCDAAGVPCPKRSKGGTTMRAAGEKPDPVEPATVMAGDRSDEQHHEGRAGQQGPVDPGSPSGTGETIADPPPGSRSHSSSQEHPDKHGSDG